MLSIAEELQKVIEQTLLNSGNLKGLSSDPVQDQIDRFNASEEPPRKTVDGANVMFSTVYDCPICKNKGAIAFLAEDHTMAVRDCACRKIRVSMMSAYRSGLGDLLTKRINDFHASEEWQKSMKQKAVEFIRNPGRGFAALGQSGSGKTHICASLCNYFISQGKAVRYFSWVEDGDRLKRLRVSDEIEYGRELKRIKNADVLYIDDLFKCKSLDKMTEKDLSLAFEIINHRLNQPETVTVVSSEWMVDQLNQVDAAVAGRLLELCREYVVQLPKGDKYNFRLTF